MDNFSRYSVFLEIDSIRPIAWSIALIGLPLNLFLIIYAVWESLIYKFSVRKKEYHRHSMIAFRNPSVWLLLNLLFCDLMGSIYMFILVISDSYYTSYYRHIYGSRTNFSLIENVWSVSATCGVAHFLATINLFMAAILTLCIGVDRFILTVYPHSNWRLTIKRAKIITAILWVLAVAGTVGNIIFNFSHFHLRSPYYYDFYRNLCLGEYYLTPSHTVRAFIVLAYLMLAYITTVILYAIIICKLRKSRLIFRSQLSSTYERRFQIVLIFITSTNIFSFFVISTTAAIDYLNGTPNQVSKLQKITSILPYSNAALDPIIYLIFRFHDIRSRLRCQSSISSCALPKVKPITSSETKSSQHENIVVTEI
ncbi:G-protein coupled receptor GRL101-like protein [Trichoplax sp. H2]|nr:G-protein coupled receptor GRL101-like protein [Trichoplax sp. H2]|eukprot:RDD38864.1 G-protein coupled receptor GRL101-like protein [Trichoplax sp. H2]